MNRILYNFFLTLAATALLAACVKQPLPDGGGPGTVTFTVGLHSVLTKAAPATTELDGASGEFQLYVAAFDKADGTLSAASRIGGDGYGSVATLNGTEAGKVSLSLQPGAEYKVVFFAQRTGAYDVRFGDGAASFSFKDGLQANDASLDAFWASVDVSPANRSYEVALRRPFAQLNVLVPTEYVPSGQTAFRSTMTVKAPTTFDLYAGEARSELSTVTFAENAISAAAFGKYADAARPHRWVGMNYVLVPASGKVDVTSFRESGMASPVIPGSVPVRVNCRTNMIGNVYSGELDVAFSVLLDTDFDTETDLVGSTNPPYGNLSDTVVFGELGLSDATQYLDPFVAGDMSVTFAGGANDGKYYNTGSAIRIYGDGSVTVSSALEIVKIEYTYSDGKSPVASDFAGVDTGDYDLSTHTWTGSAQSVTLTRATGSGHWRLAKVVVYYGADNSAAILACTAPGCFFAGNERAYVPGADQYVREYDGHDLTFVLLNPDEDEQLIVSGYTDTMQVGDAVSVSVFWKKGTAAVLNRTDRMSVVKDEGGQVWLADRSGSGYVIKK